MAANQSNVAGSSSNNTWPQNAVNKDGSPAIVLWSEDNDCYTVNGVLAPLPLSSVPLDDDEEIPQPMEKAPESPSRVDVGATQPPVGTGNGTRSSNKRSRKTTPGDHPMVFKLFKFRNGFEEYLLELHELDTGITRWSRVRVFEKKQTWDMSVRNVTPGNHVADVQQLLEDPNPPRFQKESDLCLQARLVDWIGRASVRKTGKEDKCYYHRGERYRSFNQMVVYIIYANKTVKDLKLTVASTVGNPVVSEEGEVARSLVALSSSDDQPRADSSPITG